MYDKMNYPRKRSWLMKKHRKPEPATAGPGLIMRKFLPCGVLLAVLAWPGPAAGQGLVEPPPVESFALGSGQNSGPADDDTELEDFFLQASEGAAAPAASPSVTGTPPLPPGTPVHTPAAQPTAADDASFSGTFSPPANSGQEAEFVDPVESSNDAVDPFRPAAGQEPVNSVSSTLSPPPESGGSFPPSASGQAESASVPLGQGATLPQPGWHSVSGALPQQSQYISDAPEPQFDAGSSRWVQPEIGQSFSAGSAPAAARPRPGSVPAAHTSPSERLDAVLDGEALVPTPPVQASAPNPAPSATSVKTPEGREHLRNLFSDLSPSDSVEAPAAAPAGQTAPLVPDFSGLTAQAPSTSVSQSGPIEEYEGSSAILKAGGLLTLENHYGAAEILPPLTNQPPLKTAVPTVEPPPARAEVQTRPAEAPAPAAAQAASGSSRKSKSGKAAGSKRPSSSSQARAAAKGSLMIINETGNPRIGEIYQSVLTRMGHTVVSVAQGTPGGGSAGQTVITYRPGYRAQAQAVSRHLPGRKVLAEARGGQVLASEVMVNIR